MQVRLEASVRTRAIDQRGIFVVFSRTHIVEVWGKWDLLTLRMLFQAFRGIRISTREERQLWMSKGGNRTEHELKATTLWK